MDYEALSMLVPKPVQSWTLLQIRKWLHFIDMQRFLPLFENNNFNGELLSKASVKTLSLMGISSNIQQKKFMAWIEWGFLQFNHYLFSSNIDKENICPNLNQRKTNAEKMHNKNNNLKPAAMIVQEPSLPRLKITNYQGPQTVNYIVDHKGLRIGRLSTNQIQSLQVTVQNNHANIFAKNGQFYLQDLGTRSGTFLKVHYKIELLENMMIEIGSYLLMVKEMVKGLRRISFQCVKIGVEMREELVIDLSQKPIFSFGRRNNNDFARDDQHMSGTHAKIYFFNGKFMLQDMDSTNGYFIPLTSRTWLRLSQPQQPSQPYKIEEGSIFKIGNTITYICQSQARGRDDMKMQMEQNSHICVDCNTNHRNIVFLPCKHNITCDNCADKYVNCQLCNHQVEEKIKIFI